MLSSLIQDPPPLVIVEFSDDAVVAARRDPRTLAVEARVERPLSPEVLGVSPAKPNVRDPRRLAAILGDLLDELGPIPRPETAVILPDGSSRLTVLEFETLPRSPEERLKLIRFRLAKAVPFDIESARVAFQAYKSAGRVRVLVLATAGEVARQYERAIEEFSLWPGHLSTSMANALNLAPKEGMTLFVKLSGRALNLAASDHGDILMIRSVELTGVEDALDEVLADLYPTLVFVADNLGGEVGKVALCGFGERLSEALERLPAELGRAVEPAAAPNGFSGPRDAGIGGFLNP